MKKILCAAAAALLLLAIPASGLCAFAQTAQAESAKKVIVIKKTTVLRSDAVISENVVYDVRSGGKLYINPGVNLTVKGKIKCAEGGEIYVKGNVDSTSGSQISVSGKMKILSTGCLSLGGTLAVNDTGVVKGLGTLAVQNSFDDISCKGTVTAKIAAPKPVTKDGITTVGGVLIVNKQYELPADYGTELDRDTYSAYLEMKAASGYDMSIVSGFRSYETQERVFNNWAARDGYEVARTYSALPGQSEHQSGLAIDITSLEQSYGNLPEGQWLAANCWRYGFIIRYPKGKEHITGYIYEPWHVRYLGTSTAKLVYDSGLTLEEFLGVAP
ncbi:MAG: D-alanyl-D-alanine carboxypeptidase family protein [Oscillospiraceae bacterium]